MKHFLFSFLFVFALVFSGKLKAQQTAIEAQSPSFQERLNNIFITQEGCIKKIIDNSIPEHASCLNTTRYSLEDLIKDIVEEKMASSKNSDKAAVYALDYLTFKNARIQRITGIQKEFANRSNVKIIMYTEHIRLTKNKIESLLNEDEI